MNNTAKSGRIQSRKPNQANTPKSDSGMEKRAVVATEAEKTAHDKIAKDAGQDADPQGGQ